MPAPAAHHDDDELTAVQVVLKLLMEGEVGGMSSSDLLGRPAWQTRAACRGMGTGGWFPERGQDLRPALAICAGCPVRAECQDYARSLFVPYGIWGGQSNNQRTRGRHPAE